MKARERWGVGFKEAGYEACFNDCDMALAYLTKEERGMERSLLCIVFSGCWGSFSFYLGIDCFFSRFHYSPCLLVCVLSHLALTYKPFKHKRPVATDFQSIPQPISPPRFPFLFD